MGFLTAHLGHFAKAARTYSIATREPAADVVHQGPATMTLILAKMFHPELGRLGLQLARRDPEVWTDVDINNIRPSTEAKVIDTKLRSVS